MKEKFAIYPLMFFIIALLSFIINMGFVRLYMIYLIYPVLIIIVQNILFFTSTIIYNRQTNKNKNIDIINKLIYVSYILSYLLLPDVISDGMSGRMLFLLIKVYDIYQMLLVSGILFVINILLMVIQLCVIRDVGIYWVKRRK